MKDEIKISGQSNNPETIIKQHRRGTYLIEGGRTTGEGSLILTNRRVLFLHRIEASAAVTESIRKLADAPVETVLDHALTLHKYSFEIPLSSIVKVGVDVFLKFPISIFHLSVMYLKGKKMEPHTEAFQFKKSRLQTFSKPQIMVDFDWKRAILKAMRESA